ncbi:MAG: hypothetical protein H5T95_03975 [Firmicutes bacterium]|nr:hypothetical protein [Bacillota bacterium]
MQGLGSIVTESVAVDSHTVEVRFKSKQVDNLRLAGTARAIIPKHIWHHVDDLMNFPNLDNPVGSGPLKLKRRASGQQEGQAWGSWS